MKYIVSVLLVVFMAGSVFAITGFPDVPDGLEPVCIVTYDGTLNMVAWSQGSGSYLQVIPEKIGTYICSSDFVAIQDGEQYKTVITGTNSLFDGFCDNLYVERTLRIYIKDRPGLDRSREFKLIWKPYAAPIAISVEPIN